MDAFWICFEFVGVAMFDKLEGTEISSVIQEKRKGMEKRTFNKYYKLCKCYKASKFLWKNDLSRVYFYMKQTSRGFLSKVWKSEGYLEPSRASLIRCISKNS